jgi:hypothetical protein
MFTPAFPSVALTSAKSPILSFSTIVNSFISRFTTRENLSKPFQYNDAGGLKTFSTRSTRSARSPTAQSDRQASFKKKTRPR